MTHRHRFDDNRGPSMTRRHRFDSRGPPMSTNETSRPVSRRRQPQYREYGDFDSVPDLESIDWMSEKNDLIDLLSAYVSEIDNKAPFRVIL